MMPKNLRKMYSEVCPRYLLSQLVPLRTPKSIMVLSVTEMTRLMIAYSAVIDSRAVKAPWPAYIGKANGTILPEPSNPSFLKMVTSNTISKAMSRMTNPPAIAKYSIFTPNNLSTHSPAKRKASNMTMVAMQTFIALILTPFRCILSVTGILPSGSIIAKRKMNDESTCQMSNVPKKLAIISVFLLFN